VQHLTAGPELLGMHSQRTDTGHRRERPGTRKPALGQPGLRRDTRHGPAVIGARLDHDIRTTGQPQTEHHRDLLQLEQHAGGFATQMIQTPSRQPVRQIVQRHSQNCAIGTERTGSEIRRVRALASSSRLALLTAPSSWMNRFRLTGASPATALAAAERHLLSRVPQMSSASTPP